MKDCFLQCQDLNQSSVLDNDVQNSLNAHFVIILSNFTAFLVAGLSIGNGS